LGDRGVFSALMARQQCRSQLAIAWIAIQLRANIYAADPDFGERRRESK